MLNPELIRVLPPTNVLVLHFPSFGMTLLLPVQFGGTFLEHHWSPSSILQSGRSLFLLDAFLFAALFWASLQGHHFVGFPPSILQLVEVIILNVFPWFAHLLWASSQSYYFVVPLRPCSSLLELSFWTHFFILSTCLDVTCLVLC